jgi:transcriptional coactivator p15 (PC4)
VSRFLGGIGGPSKARRRRRQRDAPETSDGSPGPSGATVAAIIVGDGVELRASLSSWEGRSLAHLRVWFRGRDGLWRPTRRGVTVAPEQLRELEEMVRALREAYVASVRDGPPGAGDA